MDKGWTTTIHVPHTPHPADRPLPMVVLLFVLLVTALRRMNLAKAALDCRSFFLFFHGEQWSSGGGQYLSHR